MAMAAELPAERTVYPHPLPHGDPPGEFHAAVTCPGVVREKFRCPGKEDRDSFTRELPGSARGWMSGHGYR